MSDTIRAIHLINQFFGGLGGEEHAGVAPQFVLGAKGPGLLIQSTEPQIEIVGTVISGDNYMAEHLDDALTEVRSLLENRVADGTIPPPDVIIAGPAFQAGRYGMACGALCRDLKHALSIPVVTAMFEENPAVEEFRREVTIVRCGENVMSMKPAVEALTAVAVKLARGEAIDPATDKVVPRGIRKNVFVEQTGAERAIDLLLRKLRDEPFETEYAMPCFDRVAPAPAVGDISSSRVALVTSGGIVPRDNPDRIASASAQCFGRYSIADVDRLTPETHQTVHGGYDPTFANADPNRVLPLDVVRSLERDGRIGRVHDWYFATVGNATSVENARRFGEEIAAQLVNEGVQAVILTST